MTTSKSIDGRKFRVTSNQSKRTFTIRVDGFKYRTNRLSKFEFESCEYNTGNDWADFLANSGDYRVVRK